MEKKTAYLFKIAAYFVWVIGGIGSINVAYSVSSTFKNTLLDNLGSEMGTTLFLITAFGVITIGLILYGISVILEFIETKLPNTVKLNPSEKKVDKVIADDESSLKVF